MISGAVCFSDRFPDLPSDSSATKYGEAVFHPVVSDWFSGGYFLHPGLPYAAKDVYYRNEESDILVLLSGSVYNRSDLPVSVSKSSEVCDPELIAYLFLEEGSAFVNSLNGDFAIFIIRPGHREAFLFRDHIGIRPLAFMMDGERLIFSADIPGLCSSVSFGYPLDRDFFLNYFKYIDHNKTPDQRVKKLPPGHYVRFSPKGLKEEKYWFPEVIKTEKGLSYDSMISDLSRLLQDAVRIRCDNRFVAGAHVSGGLDSGIVSAFARREFGGQESFNGFSWSPGEVEVPDNDSDERELVRKSCEKAGIEPHFSQMNRHSYEHYISNSYNNQGSFIEDEISDKAVTLGVNLLFSGWGGDEFISTGHSGIDLDLLRGLRLRTFFHRNPVNTPRKFARRFLFYVLYPALNILDPRAAGSLRREVRYLKAAFKRSDRQAISNFFFHRSRRGMHLKVLRFSGLPARCECWHRMGFMKGLEYRYPLLDKRIVEYMLKVPSENLCRTSFFRPLLRDIGRGVLADEVLANESKNDPVYWSHTGAMNEVVASSLMEEEEQWEKNPDLDFIDFKVLKEDIKQYREGLTFADNGLFFRSIVYFKSIHEFTTGYRRAGG